jgi:antitoxin component of MazEF toxin-antitoxin module
MPQATVGRWGRNLAVRIPGEIASAAGIREGQRVEIAAQDGEVVIRPAAPQFTLEELFRGKSAEEWRRAYAEAYEWGPDIGRESVEE